MDGQVLVPTVFLTNAGVWLGSPDHDRIEVGGIGTLTDALEAFRGNHLVDGSWILLPESDVRYDVVIGAIDAARAAEFTHVRIAGGAA